MFLKAVGRPPAEGSENPPLLVLLHGLASDENDLIGLAEELAPRLYVVSFRAPYQTGYGGFTWFGIEFLPDGSRLIDESQAIKSRKVLIDDLRELVQQLTPSKVVLGGFSQGAMMAAGVLFAKPDLLDAAWLMSGRYLPIFGPAEKPSKPLPVCIQHGLYDEVLAVTEGRELAEQVRRAGHDVVYSEYPMAHQISIESLHDADLWLRGLK